METVGDVDRHRSTTQFLKCLCIQYQEERALVLER